MARVDVAAGIPRGLGRTRRSVALLAVREAADGIEEGGFAGAEVAGDDDVLGSRDILDRLPGAGDFVFGDLAVRIDAPVEKTIIRK